MNIEQQRATFESWLTRGYMGDPRPHLERNGDIYRASGIQDSWEAWQAAIEADRQARGEPVGEIVKEQRVPIGVRFYEGVDYGAKLADGQKLYIAPQPQQQAGEPVATLHDDGHYTWKGPKPYGYNYAGWRMEVYAAPQPQQIPEGYRLQPLSEFDAMMNTRMIPEGYTLVPIEPTEEMLKAAQTEWLNDPARRTTTIYRAMLEAAPEVRT